MSQSIQPLRIHKGATQSSPTKMAQRPLSELNPMERRRNSPSFNQTGKAQLLDSSPFDSSPFAAKFNSSPFASNSPRQYWQGRDPASPTRIGAENRNPRDESPAPHKRSSIENLMKASRVKNSTMFAREQKLEYDPMSIPVVERPLAAGRPLSAQGHNALFDTKPEKKLQSSPLKSPAKFANAETIKSPMSSPGKSSLSKNSRYGHAFDPENGVWSEDEDTTIEQHELPAGKSLHRHAKSVTFDAAPPEVNEYEMATPDPSSIASGSRDGSYDSVEDDDDESIDRGSSMDRDDSFDASLEDTDKTPVVLPEDWRFMSPAIANGELTSEMVDPFDGPKRSPAPTAQPLPINMRSSPTRTDSVNSNGESRPLPALPTAGTETPSQAVTDPADGLRAAAERASTAQRSLPSTPRPCSISKLELLTIGSSSMALEDRLRLMMLQDDDKAQASKTAAEEQRERRLRRAAGSPDRNADRKGAEINIHEDEVEEQDDVAGLGEYQLPPRISRESILRKVKSKHFKDEYEHSSPVPSSSPERFALDTIDPDTPLPSLEDRTIIAEEEVYIKQEEDAESEVDVYAIPDMYRQQPLSTGHAQGGFNFGLDRQDDQVSQVDDDDESHYSTDLNGTATATGEHQIVEDEGPPTPRAEPALSLAETQEANMSLPQFASMLTQEDFGLSLSSYMTPSPPGIDPTKSHVEHTIKVEFSASMSSVVEHSSLIERPVTPVEQLDQDYDEPGTPDSVIRHEISEPSEPLFDDAPVIPEPAATIKAPGGNLKTRASLAPTDFHTMAQTRRKVSGDTPAVPPIPARHQNRPSMIPEGDSMMTHEEGNDSKRNRRSSLVQLDVPVEEIDEGLSFGLDKEFDRLIEAQKVASDSFFPRFDAPLSRQTGPEPFAINLANVQSRKQKGYLMRQNTKMIVASSASHESADDGESHLRGTRSVGNSPVKGAQAGTWTTEPWNGRIRRKSIRQSAGGPMMRPNAGPVPPLPGMASNVMNSGLDSVPQSDPVQDVEEFDESGERGRVFVKVVGVKDLDLPLPRGERSYFALTLDNGLHCVTTAWLELGRCAPIGQEFELVVLNDLEFQLTLQTKLEVPKVVKAVESPAKKVQKPSTFSRVFASPRKRKELEMKQVEEDKKKKEAEARVRRPQPTAWDLQHNLVAEDGSFARSYVSLKDHEAHAYGRPYTVDIPCFNEWAMEEHRTMGSTKSGARGLTTPTLQRRAPYKIGKLELQLLYVPKPKEAKDEDMPKSMNACVRELAEAETASSTTFEGLLSQQGGDCPYWRRRFFKLEGTKLTAFHEVTRQPRATISLAKASKLIDDKSALTQKDVSAKGGGRRKSAFAAEEEGYMFVEEGFRVRFANGETIDFYADSAADKDAWMRALAEVVGKSDKVATSWTDVVLKREKMQVAKAKSAATNLAATRPSPIKSSHPTPSPRKSSKEKTMMYSRPMSQQQGSRPLSQPQRPQSQQNSRPRSADKPLPNPSAKDRKAITPAERRQKSRSMIF